MLKPALALLMLLFAGCAAPVHPEALLPAGPAPEPATGPPDGFMATLTRVEPVRTLIDRQGEFQERVCTSGAPCLLQEGVGAAPDRQNITESRALLWRAALQVEWTKRNPQAPPVRLSLWAVAPCDDGGAHCVRETRQLVLAPAASPARIAPDDVFLQEGETGVQVRLVLDRADPAAEALGPLDVHYHLRGWVAGYVPVGAPRPVEWKPAT